MRITNLERDFANAYKKYICETAGVIFYKQSDSYTKFNELSEFKLSCDQI